MDNQTELLNLANLLNLEQNDDDFLEDTIKCDYQQESNILDELVDNINLPSIPNTPTQSLHHEDVNNFSYTRIVLMSCASILSNNINGNVEILNPITKSIYKPNYTGYNLHLDKELDKIPNEINKIDRDIECYLGNKYNNPYVKLMIILLPSLVTYPSINSSINIVHDAEKLDEEISKQNLC